MQEDIKIIFLIVIFLNDSWKSFYRSGILHHISTIYNTQNIQQNTNCKDANY